MARRRIIGKVAPAAPGTPAPMVEPAPASAPIKKKHKAAPVKPIHEPAVSLVPGPAEVKANINARLKEIKGDKEEYIGEYPLTNADMWYDYLNP